MDRHMHHQPLLADFHLLLILITSPQQVIRAGKPLICLSTFPLITNPHYNRFVDHDTSEEAIAQSGYLGLLN
jgi:hypothetical protein